MSTAAEIVQSLPKESLGSQVSEEHIAEIACQIERWEVYMPYLLGENAKAMEIEIKHNQSDYGLQKREALRRWKQKFGNKATYHKLITVFRQADLATDSSILAEYREYLVSCYAESPHPSCLGWPQAVAETYIDLPLTEAPPQPNGPDEGPRKKVVLGELF